MVTPYLNPAKGTMLVNSIYFIPTLLSVLTMFDRGDKIKNLPLFWNVLALIMQIATIVMWSNRQSLLTAISLICISFGFWENFLPGKGYKKLIFKFLEDVKQDLEESRYFCYLLISIWKIVFISAALLIIIKLSYIKVQSNPSESLYELFNGVFKSYSVMKEENFTNFFGVRDNTEYICHSNFQNLMALQIISAFICYQAAGLACRMCIQVFGFALPLIIVNPIIVLLLDHFPDSIFLFLPSKFQSFPKISNRSDFFDIIIWIIGLVSTSYTTLYIWSNKSEKMASIKDLFYYPSFCSVLTNQTLIMKRKQEDSNISFCGMKKTTSMKNPESNQIHKIYVCATMWHETMDEMKLLIKSIKRLIDDQASQQKKRNGKIHPDYYELECKILFSPISD